MAKVPRTKELAKESVLMSNDSEAPWTSAAGVGNAGAPANVFPRVRTSTDAYEVASGSTST